MLILILLIIPLAGCKSEDKKNFENFDAYCVNYCAAVGMVKSDITKEEEYTLNCVCEKIFLKIDWLKEHGGDIK